MSERATEGTRAAPAGESAFPRNEEHIHQVLEIESQAHAVYEAAEREADQLPRRVEQEAQALIEKARADAQEEARRLVASAQAPEECERILAQAEEEVRRTEDLAKTHFDQAVSHVLDQVVGRA